MSNDPWQHRASGMQCRTCMWFVPKYPESGGENPPNSDRIGRCRKRAPTMDGFPVVFGYDFCGEHKLDENKI